VRVIGAAMSGVVASERASDLLEISYLESYLAGSEKMMGLLCGDVVFI